MKVFYIQYLFCHFLTYFLSRGSRASCKPSPKTLNANMVNDMKNAGNKSVHQLPDKIAPNESLAITPQLALGAWTPSPMKLKNASAKMADGTVNVIWTIIGPIVFGSKFFCMIRLDLAPNDLDASTNSSFLICNPCPLT